jgi:LysR family transcriptional regulator, hydrogen peroxide-inducible genes activator
MQIRKLERELGVVLFDRQRSPVVPTEVGRWVVEQARVVLREAARLAELPEEVGSGTEGELRVGVLPTIGPYLLPRFVHDLASRHSRLELVLEEGLTGELLARIRNETLDAALIATAEADDLVLQPLFDEPLMAYVNRKHPLADRSEVTPAELPREDFWSLSEGHCLRAQTLRLCEGRDGAGALPGGRMGGIRMESGNLETLMRLVENGRGFTLLPALAVDGMTRARGRGRIVPFAPPVPTRGVFLVRRRVYLKRRLVEAFVEALLASLPPELKERA